MQTTLNRSQSAPTIFQDRAEAGRSLAKLLKGYANRSGLRVLALPRGGVAVAYEIAQALNAPLDVFLVRKLGVPGLEKMAMGAIASGDVRVVNEELVKSLGISNEMIDIAVAREQQELKQRELTYRDFRPVPRVGGRTVILVDDGSASGSTLRSAAAALRKQNPARLVVAVPVASPRTCDELRAEVDEMVCGTTPEPSYSVSLWYRDFPQISDQEVRELLNRAALADMAA